MTFLDLISEFLDIIAPILYGVAICYFLSPILNFIERKILRFPVKKNWLRNLRRVLSIVLTLLFVLLLLAAAVSIFIPQIVDSYNKLSALLQGDDIFGTLSNKLDQFIDGIIGDNATLQRGYTAIREFLGLGEEQSLLGKITEYVWHYIEGFFSKDALENLLNKAWGAGSAVVSFFVDALFTVLLCLYLLFTKEKQLSRVKKLVNAFFKPQTADKIYHVAYLTEEKVGKYLRMQVVDSIIVGIVSYFVFMIADLPFYPVLALIAGVTNIIPYFGPFIGAIPNAVFILIADPSKLLPFIIIVLILQQIDGNILVPMLQSNNMKMDVFWVLVGMTIMGGIFGLPGMILGVPIFSVAYILIKERAEEKLREKKLPVETSYYSQSRRQPGTSDHRPPFVVKFINVFKRKKKEKQRKDLPDSGILLEFDDDASLPQEPKQKNRGGRNRHRGRRGQKQASAEAPNTSSPKKEQIPKTQSQKEQPIKPPSTPNVSADQREGAEQKAALEKEPKGQSKPRGRRKNGSKNPPKDSQKQ